MAGILTRFDHLCACIGVTKRDKEFGMTTIEHSTQERTEGTELDATRSLTGLDRCDSCGSQAYVRVVLQGSDLLFCGHHSRQHEAKLKPIADSWHDETHKLDAK